VSSIRDLVIVGGGAAGIGASIEARANSLDALIVEAGNRLGGRAHTIEWNGLKLDLGCTWLHSAERNSLRVQAERMGVPIERHSTSWFGQYRDLGFSPEEQEHAGKAFERLEQRMRASPPASDCAADALERHEPWSAWMNAISGYINGAPLDRVSVADWLAYDDAATETNLRLPGGYGGLVVALAQGLDHKLGTPVTAISRLPEAVQLATSAGVIEARRVLVTVPTATLPRIRFDPPIAGVFDAAEQLPLGVADKLFLALEDADEFPNGAHLLGNPRSAETGSYFLRPLGMPVVEGFFGGDGARALEGLRDEGAIAFATDELASLLGSGIRRRLRPIALSRWQHDEWIGGAYSHALPGHSAARQLLANAGDDRIAFAGEAVSSTDYSTAHGAFDSGIAAVRRLFGFGQAAARLS
jgi:monoamine oxidase